ncbi:MAG: polyribonucleotide nucleotidyltransferase [Pseudomonadota bacterium]
MKKQIVSCEVGGRTLTIETGVIAKQASGAVIIKYGDSVVLSTCCVADEAKEDQDFFPLTVDYLEKTSSAGKIPGGFFKREGRLSERETLTSRFIDRPIRPLFHEDFKNEVQIINTVLSLDPEHDTDTMAMIGASAALSLTQAPFLGPIAGVRICKLEGEWIINPSYESLDKAEINLMVAGKKDAIMMVEGGGAEVSEAEMLEAIMRAAEAIKPIVEAQEKLAKTCGKEKLEVEPIIIEPSIVNVIKEEIYVPLQNAISIPDKLERYNVKREIKKAAIEKFTECEWGEDAKKIVSKLATDFEHEIIRTNIVKDKVRIGNRKTDEVRPITIDLGLLPRVHGNAIFTRGETQALVSTTLGTTEDEQIIDSLVEGYKKKFMLHYNFPPFSVGEAKFLRGPGRREIGHGALAERSISYVLPEYDKFPYTIRIVSEILESNGSSSMATVCGASLSLMHAGVPIKASIAGIAMGLVKEGDDVTILSDILGDEDHVGDMDFKVAGSKKGITALQMDIKIDGVSKEILEAALDQAKKGRLHILEKMDEAIKEPKGDLSKYAPRIQTIQVNPDKIGMVIGPGGKMIKKIIEETGVKIDILDNGKIHIASTDSESQAAAIKMINAIVEEAEVGKVYMGKVIKIMDFGAFVEILPGTEGLVHISQLAHHRVNNVEDEVSAGDEIAVKVIEIDRQGKIRLSRKEALKNK